MINDPVLINDWHPVAAVADLAEKNPLQARLLGEDLVVWQTEGQVMVWRDLCVHRGSKLSLGKVTADGCLMCPYHGWTYNKDGRCVRIPAHPDQTPPTKARTTQYPAKVKYGLVWVTLGKPEHDIPVFPEWEDSNYRNIPSGPYVFAAAAPRAIENFLDVAHFPFVHEGSLGDPSHPEIADYEATYGPEGVIAAGIKVWQPNPDGTGQGAYVTYTYKVLRPLTAYFVKNTGTSFAAFYPVCPMDELHCKGWILMSMNYGFDTPAEEIEAFQDRVTGEDIPIVESQRPELLPLDLQAELHLRSDRTAIAYRTWLRELGLTFGTS